jgi:hypothetical protein
MPGLTLNAAQVQRLCGAEGPVCGVVLAELVETNFLYVKGNGAYARSSDGAGTMPVPREAGSDGGARREVQSSWLAPKPTGCRKAARVRR